MPRSASAVTAEHFSVLEALSRWSDEQLVTLLQLRPDLATPPPRNLEALVMRAGLWPSIAACTSILNEACRQAVEALCLLPQPTPLDELAALLGEGTTARELGPVVDHLAAHALVFPTPGGLRLHPDLAQLAYPANLGPPAPSLLAARQVAELTAIARRLGVAPGRTKAETIAAITQALREPERLRRVVDEGPPGSAALAARLADGHPVAGVPSGTFYLRATTPIGWLVHTGLVATTGWDSVVMPREVGLALRGGHPFPHFRAQPPKITWRPVDAGRVDRAGTEQALRIVADVGAILEGWQETPPKLLKAGGIGIREVRRAAAAIGRSETVVARIIDLAAVAGLAGWDDESGVALPRPAFDDWLAMDAARRWGVLVAAWLVSQVHVSLAGAIGTNEKPIPPLLDRWPEPLARERRLLLLAELAGGEPGEAADGATLAAAACWDAPSVWSGGPATAEVLARWVVEEAEMLGVVAADTLSGLGRLAVGGDIAAAVSLLANAAPPVEAQFVIQADFTVVATAQLPSAVRSQLELMADLESAGGATVYRLREPSLRRAFDAGWGAAQILEFLAAHATRGVPQPLSYLVEDMDRRHGRLRVGVASCYLRSEDEALLAEILAARKTARLDFRLLAPTVLASSAPAAAVIDALRANGYLPALEDSTGAVMVVRAPVRRAPIGHPQAVPPPPAAAGGTSGGGGAGPDLGALVQRLRAEANKPAAVAARVVPLPGLRPQPGRSYSDGAPFVVPDPAERPSHIAATWDAIVDVLEWAYEEEWMVRIEHTSPKGVTGQLNAAVLEVEGSQVIVALPPAFRPQSLAVSRIRWVRVLTEAEEEIL